MTISQDDFSGMQFLKTSELSGELGVSVGTVNEMIKNGSIQAVNVGMAVSRPEWRIPPEEILVARTFRAYTMKAMDDQVCSTSDMPYLYYCRHLIFEKFFRFEGQAKFVYATDRMLKKISDSAMRLASQAKRNVYFVRCDGAIKVGVASDVGARISTLQSGSPHVIEPLCFVAGDICHEQSIHRLFRRHSVRENSEWFYERGIVEEYIKMLGWMIGVKK